MREKEILERAFAMPLTSPSYPPGPYRFVNREYLIITYRTDPAKLRACTTICGNRVSRRRALKRWPWKPGANLHAKVACDVGCVQRLSRLSSGASSITVR